MRISFILLALLLTSLKSENAITIDRAAALKAFVLLNKIRTNPDDYYEELKFEKGLKVKHTLLLWNDTLAKAAEKKAADMAAKNYLAHVDPKGYGMNYRIDQAGYSINPKWLKNKSDNFFESIYGGSEDSETAIKILIIDYGFPSFGHRKHMLGIGEWDASLTDIGIGIARREQGSKYQMYMSVLIAKHN